MRHAIVLLAVLLLLSVQVLARGADAPNVILVLSDDVGISRVGCYGAAPFRTPNLDALAATGVRFERCYSMPLCGPSRGVLLTGKYPFHTGYLGNNSSAIDPRRHPTIANVLRDAGYATCAVGKLGQSAAENDAQAPRALGFDESMLWMGRNTPDRYWSPRYCRNGEFVQGTADEYGPDLTHEFLVDFMRRHREQPFFVYYSAVLAHAPFVRTPDSRPGTKDRAQIVVDMIHYLDKQMGRLVEDVDQLGLRDRTIILFTSDNGPFGDPLGTIRGRAVGGRKGDLAEGGVREPLIVNCPAILPGGRVCCGLTDFSDIFPTVLELTGTPQPAHLSLDGRSIVPELRGLPGKPREWVYAQLAGEYFIADHAFKLYGDGTFTRIDDSPAVEKPVDEGDAGAGEARQRLAAALGKLRAGVSAAAHGENATPSAKPVIVSPQHSAVMPAHDDLRVLRDRKTIDDIDSWRNANSFEGRQMADLIVKAAGQFAVVSSTDQAIEVLRREGIINSAAYWKEHTADGKTCDASRVARLIRKLAERLSTPEGHPERDDATKEAASH